MKEQNFSQCANYPNLKVEPRELHAFKKHLLTSSFSQEVVTYKFLFNSFFENENIEENIGNTNKIDPYSLLINTTEEMTNHVEDHWYLEDIMEVRDFFTKKILESKNIAASVLTDSNNNNS